MGEVLQPAIFELRDNETLKDVLQYAGGVRACCRSTARPD